MTTKPFRRIDSITLQETFKVASQMVQTINQVCEENKTIPQQLPDSLVPTQYLYLLAAGFMASYDKLLEYELAKTGNLLTDRNNLH
jgi:hypothetical protein